MRLKTTDYLNKRQETALQILVDRVNEADDTRYGFPEDADRYVLLYVGNELAACAAVFEMGDTYRGRTIQEVAAFTAPGYRRLGCFRKLIDALAPVLEGCAVRFAVYRNPDCDTVLEAIGAEHDHDELMMVTETERFAKADELALLIDWDEGKAETAFCECYFREFGEAAYIFGVLTFEQYQRKGYASKMLKTLFAAFAERGIPQAMLQVSSENTPAIRLYRSLGMDESDRLCYYYLLK